MNLKDKYRKQINETLKLLKIFYKDAPSKVGLWLESENPMLGNIKPIEMILMGRGEKLIKYIKDHREMNGW